MKTLLKSGATMVDLGANLGLYTVAAARIVGSMGRVYAFEPNPDTYALLQKRVREEEIEDIVTAVQKAVSNRSGDVSFHINVIDGAASSLHVHPGTRERIVQAITLDEFFESEGWPPVQFIKMDIEGAEEVALEGMAELCRRNPGLKMITEFSPSCFHGRDPMRFFASLLARGFSRISLIQREPHLLSIPNDIAWLTRRAAYQVQNLLCEFPRMDL
jgi:FkbM family methyltransferase